MKYKSALLFFNGVVLLLVLGVVAVPFFILGGGRGFELFRYYWIPAVSLLSLTVASDLLFFSSWRSSSLIEKKDWRGLLLYLEGRIYGKRKFRTRDALLAITTASLLSDIPWIERLEKEVRKRHRKQLARLALSLGVPYAMHLGEEAEIYFGSFKDDPRVWSREWVVWFYGSALLSQNKGEQAKTAFFQVLSMTREPLLSLLSLHLLSALVSSVEVFPSQSVKAILKKFPSNDCWENEIQKNLGVNLYYGLLVNSFREAYQWGSSSYSSPPNYSHVPLR